MRVLPNGTWPASSGSTPVIRLRGRIRAARLRLAGEEAPFGMALSMAAISRSRIGYTGSMAKRLVEIDDDLLERARSIARTSTIKETVNAALQRLVDDERVMRHVERLRGSGALDLARIEEARRPRTAR